MEGSKKVDRISPKHEHYKCVVSYNTMDTYRNVWNNFFKYLKEHFKLKNCELIIKEYVQAYIEYKIEYYSTKQHLEKITSALGKLEFALNKYSKLKYQNPINYDFEIRQEFLNHVRDYKLVANNYKNRVYTKPFDIVNLLSTEEDRIAALIQ